MKKIDSEFTLTISVEAAFLLELLWTFFFFNLSGWKLVHCGRSLALDMQDKYGTKSAFFFFTNANHKSNVKENTNDNPAFVCIKMYQFNVSFGHFFSLTLLLYIHFKTSKPFFFFSVKRWSIFLLSVCSVLTMHVYWNRMQFTPWNIETSFHLRSFLIRVTTLAAHLYSLSRIMIGFGVVVGQILLTN